ncbi:hypothetical protein HYX00_01015 [Candidatus Woesearchaeota archaeon]|nr:hypothetical protein [Candidatus Woesearchaeota archaeon]
MARVDSTKLSSSYTPPYSYHNTHLFERPAFQYILAFSILATLIISIIALVNVYQLKKAIVPKTINVNDFLKKLTSHNEMKNYVGVAPLNIVQINNNNLANLQAQINGLDASYAGNFIVQYTDRIVVYDYDNDKLRGTVSLQQPQQAELPTDFFTKLNEHSELQGLQNQQPIGGQLDSASLNTLKQQFPEIYENAKVGDFLLRYQTKLVIYDYNQDKIVNVINLG